MEKAHEAKDLDLTSAARGVWLVKVPKYLSERWKKGNPGGEVGKLRITKSATGKTDVLFSLNQSLAVNRTESTGAVSAGSAATSGNGASAGGAIAPKGGFGGMSGAAGGEDPLPAVPINHKFSLMPVKDQTMVILSTEQIEADPIDEAADVKPGAQSAIFNEGRVAIVGRVSQRGECRPMNDDASYMSHIKSRMQIGNTPVHKVVQLEKSVINYKPKSIHAHTLEYNQKKKEEGKKIRGEKDTVMEMLFEAFEKHQYYNVKDLVRVTKQPITFLKEILKEFCVYNMKAPNKNTWELKPEYRHYRQPSGSAVANGGTSS